MSGLQQDDDRTRRAVGEWFYNAWKHASIASYLAPRFKTLALHMTQQSMEFAAKGIGLNAKLSHKQITKTRHNNLNLFIWFHDIMLKQTKSAPYLNEWLFSWLGEREELKADTQVENLLQLTASPEDAKLLSEKQRKAAKDFYESALTMTPEQVGGMLNILSQLRGQQKRWRKAINHVTRTPMSLTRATGNDFSESLSRQVRELTNERLNQISLHNPAIRSESLVDHFVKILTEIIGETQLESELETMGWRVTFSKKDAKRLLFTSFEVPVTFTEMLIVGSIAWPHESYTRYPASPDAALLSFGEAAKRRQLGSEHYSENVGAIKHIKTLSRLAVSVTRSLQKSHEEGFLFTTLEK
ncbi:MAG: hypothetical protein F4Y25_08420 [Chloroflexi bacterium]|nr:hypothetical protein [Chloroflexota bacterium]